MLEIGVLKAAQENSDRGDAPDNGSTGLGLGLALERLLVANVDVGVEDAGQHHAPARIVDLGGGFAEALAYDRDLAAGDGDIRLHLANTGDHQGAAAND